MLNLLCFILLFLQKWSGCQDEMSRIRCELEELETRLQQHDAHIQVIMTVEEQEISFHNRKYNSPDCHGEVRTPRVKIRICFHLFFLSYDFNQQHVPDYALIGSSRAPIRFISAQKKE